jgi:hypothetical protein
MIAIPLIRRELTSDLLGRHIYLFEGSTSAPSEILRRLAEAGAQEGTVVLSVTEGKRLGAAALFRPHLALGAVPLFSAIATLALAEAVGNEATCATPLWPDQVTIEGDVVAKALVAAGPAGDRAGYVILGADIDVRALEARGSIEWNLVVAAFLNALDKWATAYAARGPAAVRAAIRFLPRGPVSERTSLEAQHAS